MENNLDLWLKDISSSTKAKREIQKGLLLLDGKKNNRNNYIEKDKEKKVETKVSQLSLPFTDIKESYHNSNSLFTLPQCKINSNPKQNLKNYDDSFAGTDIFNEEELFNLFNTPSSPINSKILDASSNRPSFSTRIKPDIPTLSNPNTIEITNNPQLGINANPFLKIINKPTSPHNLPIENSTSSYYTPVANILEWQQPFPWDEDVSNANLHIFGYDSFRENQREIINASLSNRDIFVCMPTGGGKSLTFQIPSIIRFGVTLVIMPLISLIQDQTSFLTSIGIRVLFLSQEATNSLDQNYYELFHSNNEEDLCRLIFLTPEKVSQSRKTLNFLHRLYDEKLLLRVVIDEAHCVSQWGREFRPDYLNLKMLKHEFPTLPILAVTATAPNKIRQDVIRQLGMIDPLFFRSSYNRTNLFIEIRNKKDSKNIIKSMVDYIKENNYHNASGLIYCSSKKNCETVCEELIKKYHLSAAYYHASLPEKKKTQVQEQWKCNKINIIVATVAFGMGINKADVRFVIHHSMPKSFEGYYQEIGRAGRDGKQSHCVLYYSHSDRKIIEFLMTKTNLNKQMITENLRKTTEMIDYCEETYECRRVIALCYFDEEFHRENCKGMCDNCHKGKEPIEKDVTDDVIKILSFLNSCYKKRLEITTSNMIDYLRGLKQKKGRLIADDNHLFGIMKEISQNDMKKMVRKLILRKYIDEHLNVSGDNVYSRIEISNEGIKYVNMKKDTRPEIRMPFTAKDKQKDKDQWIGYKEENSVDYDSIFQVALNLSNDDKDGNDNKTPMMKQGNYNDNNDEAQYNFDDLEQYIHFTDNKYHKKENKESNNNKKSRQKIKSKSRLKKQTKRKNLDNIDKEINSILQQKVLKYYHNPT